MYPSACRPVCCTCAEHPIRVGRNLTVRGRASGSRLTQIDFSNLDSKLRTSHGVLLTLAHLELYVFSNSHGPQLPFLADSPGAEVILNNVWIHSERSVKSQAITSAVNQQSKLHQAQPGYACNLTQCQHHFRTAPGICQDFGWCSAGSRVYVPATGSSKGYYIQTVGARWVALLAKLCMLQGINVLVIDVLVINTLVISRLAIIILD